MFPDLPKFSDAQLTEVKSTLDKSQGVFLLWTLKRTFKDRFDPKIGVGFT